MRNFKVGFLVATFVLLFVIGASAQQRAALTGVVTDPSGAVVPEAQVTLTDTATGAEYTTRSSGTGVYTFAALRPGGGYIIKITAEGFRTFTIHDVYLAVNTTATYNIQLEVGAVAETVTVEAAGQLTLNTVDASVGNEIEPRRIIDLPVQIRITPARLLGLAPGVVANTGGGANRDGSITGSRTDQINITLDGLDVNDMAGGFAFTTVANAPIDTIQEFRTVTAGQTTTDGRSGAGQVQLVTKSGTNDWHGSLRWFHRNNKTSANEFFNNKAGIPVPKLIQNQFGGNIGGPVVKDRLFFFFDVEMRRDSSQDSQSRTVPLAHVFQGSLAYVNNGAGCDETSKITNAPSCITTLTSAQLALIDPLTLGPASEMLAALQDRYPVGDPTLGGDGVNTGGHRFNTPIGRDDRQYTSRIDFQKGDHKLFGRISIRDDARDRTPTQQFAQDPKGHNQTNQDWAFAVGHTWLISPRITNNFTAGTTVQDFQIFKSGQVTFPNQFDFSGPLSDPFLSLSVQGRKVPVPTYRDDFTLVKGNHTIQAGGSFKPIKQKSNLTNDFNFVDIGLGGATLALNTSLRPADIFDDDATHGQWDEMFSLILGRYASIGTNFNYGPDGTAFDPGTGKRRNFKYNELELYIGDFWRARPDLSISYGLRWQYYAVPFEANGFQASNDVDFASLWDIRLQNAAAGLVDCLATATVACTSPRIEPLLRYDLAGKANDARGYYEPDLNNFAPRAAVAWNPSFKSGFLGGLFGDQKTVVRAGGSITYDRVTGAITFIQDQVSYLFDNSASISFGAADPVVALTNDPRFTGFSTLPAQNTAPVITRPFTPFLDSLGNPVGNRTAEFNYTVLKDFKTPFSYNYNLSVQREIPGDMVVEVGYVGRLGRDLFSQADPNQVLDHLDVASGQHLFDAWRSMVGEMVNDGLGAFSVTPQLWFENQMNAARAARGLAPCPVVFGIPCTQVVTFFFGSLVRKGDLSDTIQALYFNRLLLPNVAMGSQFSVNSYISNHGRSNYNGLLVSARKRFSHGFQFDANYTFAHSIDTDSEVINTVIGGIVWDLTDLKVGRGNSDFDARHVFNANWVVDIPVGHGRAWGSGMPGWANQIVGGWSVSGIWFYRTGFAFDTETGSFPINFFIDSPGVFVGPSSALAVDIHADDAGNLQFFRDPSAAVAAFAQPFSRGAASTGNRNILHGPSFSTVDFAVLKSFKMPWGENHRLQFRWEMFNALNHPNFLEPSADINSSTFGQITDTRGDFEARVMQFALRYDF